MFRKLSLVPTAMWLFGTIAIFQFNPDSGWAGDADPLRMLNYSAVRDGGFTPMGRDNTSINSTPFKISSVQTSGDYQFTSFYDEAGLVHLARRRLDAGDWSITPTSFTSNNIDDPHNVISFGLDGDGYMHLSWGMHNDDLLYTRSTTPVTNNAPMNFVGQAGGNSQAINTMIGVRETPVTYPNFYSLPDGNLMFNYRTGISGNGEYNINRYDRQTQSWSSVQAPWIENQDSPGAARDYNAYPHNFVFDGEGGLHASWTFRFNADSPGGFTSAQTNNNLYFGFSPDEGQTWYRDVDATRPYGQTITRVNSELIVPIPEGSSLINTGTMAVDAQQSPAIATYWAPHKDRGDGQRQVMFVWQDGQEWKTSQVTRNPFPNSSGFAGPDRPTAYV